jgi:hypothetical protein
MEKDDRRQQQQAEQQVRDDFANQVAINQAQHHQRVYHALHDGSKNACQTPSPPITPVARGICQVRRFKANK